MKYTAIIAVAVFSLLLAIPLSHRPAKHIDLIFKPVAAKVAITPAAKPTITHQDIVAPVVQPAPPPVVAPPAYPSGSHEDLMTQAGIDPSDFAAVSYIVTRESGWNADATEPTTGAHGLPQALPYSKTGCGWVDAVCQLRWANGYATARYGGWASAEYFWEIHHNW